MKTENSISKTKNALLILPSENETNKDLLFLKENFCGEIIENLNQTKENQKIYVCGDLKDFNNENKSVLIIKELSTNYENLENFELTDLGKTPILFHDAGILYRNLFNDEDYFKWVESEHDFQELTESIKNTKALRSGIYMTDVKKEESDENGEILHYHLLRCSSNLTGPTDNFRNSDRKIIKRLNDCAKDVFENDTDLNHVLAQIYRNKVQENGKQAKAKIKAHSDKTKDMDENGLIAFCTFYDRTEFEQLKPSKKDPFDWTYKNVSGLSRLLFKLKKDITDSSLVKEFSVTLYPNSAFIIPLSTNRLYTHEIRTSMLNVDQIPVRMGYVARCSNMKAQYKNENVYIQEGDELLKMVEMTEEMRQDLYKDYKKENDTKEKVDYEKIRFSMNVGDYKKPIY
ncbi:hypothetical protein [Aureivirga sp. CE67]|uniref:hypothetical protein n=1 Tax=Aureivirga sp. CE67 TaxID=1788983 RepID=UPI0018C98837|nr:hypothetical protein [Aureivirga sp. CE67]